MKTTILFVLNISKTNSKGLSPISCRITYQKKRKQFFTGISVNTNNWNSKQQLIKPPEPDENYINTQLSLIRQNLNQAFLFLKQPLKQPLNLTFIHFFDFNCSVIIFLEFLISDTKFGVLI
jgi:hypothetical protein